MLLSRATGSVTSGDLPAIDIVDRKAREIAGDDTVTTGNGESCQWQHCNFCSKLCQQRSVAPYSTDNRSTFRILALAGSVNISFSSKVLGQVL